MTPPPLIIPFVVQLYKVFPIANAYYLSQILFSPNPKTPNTRILIGKEAHNAEDYGNYTKSYQGRSWPEAVLRFTVYDETPHKLPTTSQRTSLNLEDGESRELSFAWSATTSTAVNGGEDSDVSQTPTPVLVAESATAAEERQNQRTVIENERRVILDRIRERTFTRSSVTPSFTTPASNKPSSSNPSAFGASSCLWSRASG